MLQFVEIVFYLFRIKLSRQARDICRDSGNAAILLHKLISNTPFMDCASCLKTEGLPY